MWLIQINENEFVDAEKINWIKVEDEKVSFSVAADDPEVVRYKVSDCCRDTFLNHLQALNKNISRLTNT